MQVEYQFEPRDIEAWIAHARFRSRDHRVAYWVAIVGIGGGGAWMGSRLGWDPQSTVLCGVVGLLFGSAFAVLGMKASAQVTANASSGASQTQFGLHHLDVTSEGIAEVGPAGTHSHSWGQSKACGKPRSTCLSESLGAPDMLFRKENSGQNWQTL